MIRASNSYVVELDGVTNRFSNGRLETIENVQEVTGDTWFITDIQESISKTFTVNGPPQYADMIARKQMQESGEFNGPVSIIPHRKQKRSGNTTDIFFTAYPSSHASIYVDATEQHDDSILLFPLYSVLYSILQRIRSKEPVALVFQHGRFADVLIGSKRNVILANRCLAFDTADEQLLALWETVKEDITNAETANSIEIKKIYLLTWVNSGELSGWLEDTEVDVEAFPTDPVFYQETAYDISFIKALRSLSGVDSVSPIKEKLFYFGQRWAPFVNMLILLGSLVLMGGQMVYSEKAQTLQNRLNALRSEISGIRIEAPLEVNSTELKQTVQFVSELAFYRKAPSFKDVLNDVALAVADEMRLDVFKIDYNKNHIQLELFGRIEAPFNEAYKKYRDMLAVLSKSGYSIQEKRFDTEINTSQFLFKFKKRIL
jgi:hypothetical protein